MSACDLTITFDREDRTFEPGEPITGHVHVEVNKNVTCKALTIELCWETHGRGNRDSEAHDTISKEEIRWIAGEKDDYAFSFEAPRRPLTYHGTYLNIDTYVRVRADIPWAIDPKAQEEVIVLPGPCSEEDYRQAIDEENMRDENQSKKEMGLVGKVIVFAIVGALVIVFAVAFWWLLIPLGLFGLVKTMRQRRVNKLLGGVDIVLERRLVVPGEYMPLAVTMAPQKDIQINHVAVTLKGQEICVSGSGTNKSTHRHTLHEAKLSLAEDEYIRAGKDVRLEAEVPIPETDAYSFDAQENDIRWELDVRVDLRRCPDWKGTREVILIPANTAPRVQIRL